MALLENITQQTPFPGSFRLFRESIRDQVTIDGLELEYAITPEEQTRGLMFRKHLAKDAGMLFVYNTPIVATFWMKNTHIPLDIAFINGLGEIIDIQPMEPMSTHKIKSPKPCKYALEVNRGWFSLQGHTKGSIILV